MADPRFHITAGPYRFSRLLFELGLESPRADGAGLDHVFSGVASLLEAQPDELSFLHNRKYLKALRETKAGAVLVSQAFASDVPDSALTLVVEDPYLAFAKISALFHPRPARPTTTSIHPLAAVAPSAVIGEGVRVDAFAVIGEGAEVGAGTVVGSHATIGDGVALGEDCLVHTHVSISHALIGDRVTLKPGVRIGQGGFGWALFGDGGRHVPIPQVGRVLIEDDVELGANTAVDRGAGPDTRIGAGTVIDNLCQIAHNVLIGEGCAIAGRTAIGGSAVLEDSVLIGGGCLVFGHLTVGAGSQIQAGSHVTKSCQAGSILRGVPARDYRLYLREEATLRRIARKSATDAPD